MADDSFDIPLPPPAAADEDQNGADDANGTSERADLDPPAGGGDEDDLGPMPMPPQPAKKKRKVAVNEQVYLDNLPTCDMYEKSYMHRQTITHVCASNEVEFVMTGSADGHIKFWKKSYEGIEFVKHFRAHIGALLAMAVSSDGIYLGSVGSDNAFKLFDILNFDMTCMMKLDFTPLALAFVHPRDSAEPVVAISEKGCPKVRLVTATDPSGTPLRVFERHMKAVHLLHYVPALHCVVSADKSGGLEMWDPDTLQLPTPASTGGRIQFTLKSDTDLFELLKSKTHALSLTVSPDGNLFACLCEDFHLRVFRLSTGKMIRKYDESIDMYTTAQSDPLMEQLHLDKINFGRRLATEKELRKSDAFYLQGIVFDESSTLLIYPCMVGIKVVNIITNNLSRILGRPESGERFLAIALFQGKPQRKKATGAIMSGSGDRIVQESADPILFCSSYKRQRFYLFSRREPPDSVKESRDIFNEKPTKEEAQAMAGIDTGEIRLGKQATIHTTVGDIVVKLFPNEVPRTVENFTVHSRNGYYDNCLFHRVIKGFMLQTGDPNGDGTGGESIWGGEFEDEFHRALKHDRPYTVSMANAGPNTNGSQFFVTTVPCPWLDNKHTVFGRVVQGMDVCHAIENVRTDGEDRPYKDIRILTIKISA
ncbi:unnamed protein product [Vitrella brassicaformis CCMP3155]|uniref:peptidylprolyl isomerase n=1 Tax=Vitrella brassicaformis (strain CCMP3155) TaxID=1169540 RepID=A0A0G4FEP8_VITBC|nr:unnamed protein product [Vitrella brassicaformis CCMP3155]|eukprot:CEM11716.1 unnamed protein product [Vitrella brassicaformis CCMP3155]